MAENSGSSLWTRLAVGLVALFVIGLFFAPEKFSSQFFRAINAMADGSAGWSDNPKVGMVIVAAGLVYLFIRLVRN